MEWKECYQKENTIFYNRTGAERMLLKKRKKYNFLQKSRKIDVKKKTNSSRNCFPEPK